jgi:hypothetical protein
MIGPSSESLADASFALSVSRANKPTGLSVLSLTDVCGPMSSFDEAQRIADLLGKGPPCLYAILNHPSLR